MTARSWALATVLLFGAATLLTLVLATPWHPVRDAGISNASPSASSGDFGDSERAKAKRYAAKARPPSYASLAVGLLVLLVLGLTRWGSRLTDLVSSPLGGGWVWRAVLGGIAVSLVVRLVTLPFGIRLHAVRRDFGLSTQSWGGWSLDVLKMFGLSSLVTIAGLVALFGLIRWMPRGWPAVAGASAAVLVLAISFLFPVVVEPLFAKFTPLPEGQLRSSLIELAERDGIPVRDVLVADASRRTTALNAYVSGFGATRRLVIYDTLLERAPAEEVRNVVAHELGHTKSRDVLLGSLTGALAAGALTGVLALLLTTGGWARRAGGESVTDPRALAFVVAVVTVLGALSGPAQAYISRRIETRADLHALDLTRDPATFARMQRRLVVENLADPDPPTLAFGLFATHPTGPQRIALARAWARVHGQADVPQLAP